MSTNPYKVTDRTHANIMLAVQAVEQAQANAQKTVQIVADAIGVPAGYIYNPKEQAFVAPKDKPDIKPVAQSTEKG